MFGDFGFNGSFGRFGISSGGGSAPASVLSAVQADGWQGVWASATPPTFDPDNNPITQRFSRAGYDANGNATTYTEDLVILRRVRNPYSVGGAQLTDTASNVALQDYVLSTDSAVGVTNSSTEISPKPIAAWTMRDRQMVGDSIYWEIAAFHYYARNGRQVACVRVRGNDGTTQTPWQVVSTTAVSTYCEDANAVEVYSGTLDVSTLAAGTVSNPASCWLEAEVMPWIGGTASVCRSEDSSVAREFSRRYFGRNVTRAASPAYAYVASAGASPAGNDATGVWSTDPTVADDFPFLTVTGALTAMNVGAGNQAATNSIMDGCRIRIVDTVSMGAGPATARAQIIASLIVERAPGTARAAAIITHGASFRPRLTLTGSPVSLTEGSIVFNDVTINRTGAFTFIGEAANQLQCNFHNVAMPNTNTGSIHTSNAHVYFFGITFPTTVPSLGQTALQKRIMRGIVADLNNTGMEGWVTVGCNITRVNALGFADPSKPFISYSNKWLNPSSAGGVGSFQGVVSGGDLGGLVWVQNLIEATHTTTATAGFRFANDSPALGNIVHAVIHHNTETGYGSVNRRNQAYDEAPVARFHKFISQVGDLPSQLNTKGDVFQLDATRLGQFAYTHGVGCRGNFTMFQTNSAVTYSEMQTFPGLNCSIGTSSTVRNDPLFTNYQGTGGSGGTPSSGAGGGTYTLTGPSPARSRVANPVLAFDLAGNARPSANDAAGAYA
jgi:hypothetical protein